MRIIYHDGNGIAVITPTTDLPIEEVALKDVPAGTPFLIIKDEDVPARADRANWEVDFSTPAGIGIGHEAWTVINSLREQPY